QRHFSHVNDQPGSNSPRKPEANQANGGRVDRTKLAYLALEGGGGKGATFLGAIQALKTMKILPIDIENPGTSQIAGISGSSAGAITALLLGMGMTAQQLKAVLSRSSTFAGFFDGPAPGQYRLVNSRGESAVGGKPRIDRPSTARRALTMAAPLPMLALGAAASALLDALLGTLDSPHG
ncbi:patatin-like phospholipase family protein, partial [Nonomuraea glycinis]|uniref:patatin-like phospholipase family protein n=1 Tax=Nonomuraea glycinis TaxID=2047744 RepID=UPI001E5F19EC